MRSGACAGLVPANYLRPLSREEEESARAALAQQAASPSSPPTTSFSSSFSSSHVASRPTDGNRGVGSSLQQGAGRILEEEGEELHPSPVSLTSPSRSGPSSSSVSAAPHLHPTHPHLTHPHVVVGRPALYVIERDQFELLQCIGGGSFGRVHRGLLRHGAPPASATKPRRQGGRTASREEGSDNDDAGTEAGEGCEEEEGEDEDDGEIVAVKELTATSCKPQEFARQAQEYYTEAELLSECSHINIAQLFGVCVQAPTFYMLMEYAAGGPLSSLLNRATLKPSVIVDWALQMARGMNYLHCECRAACVVHRDLKSANILLAKVRAPGERWC